MSQRDVTRLAVLGRLQDGRITAAQAASALGLSGRQVRRLRRRFEAGGAAALCSKHHGRAPNNRLSAQTSTQAVALVRARYPDFGPSFANEKLRELHDLHLSTESLRGLMIGAGLWKSKHRRRLVHQSRERRPYFGELVQIDGSRHDWFEGRAPICTLLVYIDDATSALLALQFVKSESTASYFATTAQYLQRYGKPRAFYSDRHSIFRTSKQTHQAGVCTQFARAMEELDVELICANSPQAKGRVERANGTLQHRLVLELRLHKIDSIESANAFLPTFIAAHNERFAKPPQLAGDVHRPLTAHEDLRQILAHTYVRTLSKNLTFQCDNIVYSIEAQNAYAVRGARVNVRQLLDGSVVVERRGKPMAFTTAPQARQPAIASRRELAEPTNRRVPNPKKAHTPAPNHPWRKSPTLARTA